MNYILTNNIDDQQSRQDTGVIVKNKMQLIRIECHKLVKCAIF